MWTLHRVYITSRVHTSCGHYIMCTFAWITPLSLLQAIKLLDEGIEKYPDFPKVRHAWSTYKCVLCVCMCMCVCVCVCVVCILI